MQSSRIKESRFVPVSEINKKKNVCLKKNQKKKRPYTLAFAMQSSGRNCNPAPDLVL